ncbi:MAG: N-acetyltransferase [Epsilonproteobacteria bacterium]|nr:N-acetyltransferase [Campylobacterota bacterium]
MKPTLRDIPLMQELLSPFVQDGIILQRDADEIATNIRSYEVIKKDNQIIAIGALHIYSQTLAEIRSLAVNSLYQKQGFGAQIMHALEQEARNLGVKSLLVLTYQSNFFKRLGFVEIPKEQVPEHKVWSDCIKCRHFPNCNEISLIKTI